MARFELAVDKTRPVLFYKEFIGFLFTDTESDTSIDLEIGTLLSQGSEDSVGESPVHVQTRKFKKSDRPSRFKNLRSKEVTAESQSDQTLINERVLSQLDAIGKRLTAIEQSSASAARPKAKKSDC